MMTHLQTSVPLLRGLPERLLGFWADLREAYLLASEFAVLNALSDKDLADMGLTRACLKRHLRQKASAKVLSGPHGGWHERAPGHRTR